MLCDGLESSPVHIHIPEIHWNPDQDKLPRKEGWMNGWLAPAFPHPLTGIDNGWIDSLYQNAARCSFISGHYFAQQNFLYIWQKVSDCLANPDISETPMVTWVMSHHRKSSQGARGSVLTTGRQYCVRNQLKKQKNKKKDDGATSPELSNNILYPPFFCV